MFLVSPARFLDLPALPGSVKLATEIAVKRQYIAQLRQAG